MALTRRTLLGVVITATASPAVAQPLDMRKTERSIGSLTARKTVIECFSLTCPHCAGFALGTLVELKAKFIEPGKLRWVFYDFPTDMAALRAAMVARYLPLERYDAFLTTLFQSQDSWAYAGGEHPEDALWKLANAAGMDRDTFDQAIADTDLRNWIVARAMDAQTSWSVDATPSFVLDGKLYEGGMSTSEFAAILAH